MSNRVANIKRETKETNISLELDVDGSGKWEINTGIKIGINFLKRSRMPPPSRSNPLLR